MIKVYYLNVYHDLELFGKRKGKKRQFVHQLLMRVIFKIKIIILHSIIKQNLCLSQISNVNA